jgi:hypothetical protein
VTPKITIAYVTNRANPRFEWFVESLCWQTTPEQRANLQVVLVDGCLWSPVSGLWRDYFGADRRGDFPFACESYHDLSRHSEFERIVAGRFPFLHIPPKPCAYQGPFRQTKRDFFCAGNTRNTAFIVAQHPYVVFVDDLSVLMRGWFNQVFHAAEGGYIVCGAYKKVKNLSVRPSTSFGELDISWEHFEPGVDSRWNRGSDSGIVPWHGTGMFGCSFGVPLEAALEVDGNDAACNSQGGEDYDFGIRLERAGWAFFFNRNALTLESEELHHDGSKLPQERHLVIPQNLPPLYDSYRHINEAEKYWSDHVLLNRISNETDRILPVIGDNLRELRAHFLATGLVPVPAAGQLDWRTGKPLSEL